MMWVRCQCVLHTQCKNRNRSVLVELLRTCLTSMKLTKRHFNCKLEQCALTDVLVDVHSIVVCWPISSWFGLLLFKAHKVILTSMDGKKVKELHTTTTNAAMKKMKKKQQKQLIHTKLQRIDHKNNTAKHYEIYKQ